MGLERNYCGKDFWNHNGVMLQHTPSRGWVVSNQYELTSQWIYEIPQNWSVICCG